MRLHGTFDDPPTPCPPLASPPAATHPPQHGPPVSLRRGRVGGRRLPPQDAALHQGACAASGRVPAARPPLRPACTAGTRINSSPAASAALLQFQGLVAEALGVDPKSGAFDVLLDGAFCFGGWTRSRAAGCLRRLPPLCSLPPPLPCHLPARHPSPLSPPPPAADYYPPTVFVSMVKDEKQAGFIEADRKIIEKLGSPVEVIEVRRRRRRLVCMHSAKARRRSRLVLSCMRAPFVRPSSLPRSCPAGQGAPGLPHLLFGAQLVLHQPR